LSRRYEEVGHELLKVYVGFPMGRDLHSCAAIPWRVQRLRIFDRPWARAAEQLDAFVHAAAALQSSRDRMGGMPPSFAREFEMNEADAAEALKAERQPATAAGSALAAVRASSPSKTQRQTAAVSGNKDLT